MIHGFTGGEFEIAPLSEFLQAQYFKTKTFELKGLTGSRSEMMSSNRFDWIEKAETELKKIIKNGKSVHLIGFSTGAIIATHLSVKYKEHVKSLTLLATPIFTFNVKEIVKTFFQADKVKNYVKKFLHTPYCATREFKKIVQESLNLYKQVEAPTLIIQGDSDHLVQAKSANYLYLTIGAKKKKLLLVEKCGHLICLSKNQSQVFHEVYSFISNYHYQRLSSCS
ncbi:alpha/beta hydrolase [Bacillus horti]